MKCDANAGVLRLALLLSLGILMGCATLHINTPTENTPVISSFVATPATVAAGEQASLTGIFVNGKGVITPGNLAVTSGTPVNVTPSATTTYTLRVTSSLGTAVTASATVTVNAAAAPVIARFTATPATIVAGASSNLTGVFSNGTGVITPGNLAAVSGTPVSVTPGATTTYTLTVTNGAATAVDSSTTVTVTPAVTPAAELGVNIGGVNDFDRTQMFADAMKQARKFGSVTTPYDESANVDAQGWPTHDAGVVVISGNQGPWSAGTYALTFTGQATVASSDDANVSVGAVMYNSATNTSTATVTAGSGYSNIFLVFTGTKRTPASAPGTGVTNVSLMRPSINGTPHAAGTLFTDRFLDRLKYFTAIRMMDYLNTNNSTEAAWSDRPIPAYASQQEAPPHASQNLEPQYATGASYEYAIQLANQANKDLWLNVPHLAFGGTYRFSSTTWAGNLALLLKYGSDATGNPYTGLSGSSSTNPQPAAGPVNPPLHPGLHVYFEYSNEVWSTAGDQATWILQQANAAIAAGDPDLDWDHSNNEYDVAWRIEAKGLMLIANAFSSVYGSSDFGAVYRPIYAGQIANTGTYGGLAYLDSQHGGANQYVWAIAGGPYVDFNSDVPGNTLTAAQIISGMQAYQNANIVPWIAGLAPLAAAEKLEGGMVAYEGGQGAVYDTPGAIAAQTTPGMRSVTTTVLDSWFAQGGGTFFYYKLCSEDTWGLATDISYDIDADSGWTANPVTSSEAQPKWGAIKQVATVGH